MRNTNYYYLLSIMILFTLTSLVISNCSINRPLDPSIDVRMVTSTPLPTKTAVAHTATPETVTQELTPVVYITATPTFTPETLVVTWTIDPICRGSSLLRANIKIIVSGGEPDYEFSPSDTFNLTAGQIMPIAVTSSDGQEWKGVLKAPESCRDTESDNVITEVSSNNPSTNPPPIAPSPTNPPPIAPSPTNPPPIAPSPTNPPPIAPSPTATEKICRNPQGFIIPCPRN